MMTNGGRKGRIFRSHPHMNNGFLFLLTTKYLILEWINMKKASIKSLIRRDATWCRHLNITMTLGINVRPECAHTFFMFPTGWYGYVRWEKTTEIQICSERKILNLATVGQAKDKHQKQKSM